MVKTTVKEEKKMISRGISNLKIQKRNFTNGVAQNNKETTKINPSPSPSLTQSEKSILQLNLHEVVHKIKTKEITSLEVMEATLKQNERFKNLNSYLYSPVENENFSNYLREKAKRPPNPQNNCNFFSPHKIKKLRKM